MTLTAAWVRSVNDTEEMVFASDSRLTGGLRWDCAPKILPLKRGDAVLAFAGHLTVAYPLLLQLSNTVDSWDQAFNRSQPLPEFKGHLVRVINDMLRRREDVAQPLTNDPAETFLLLGGFCWHSQRYLIWTLHFDPAIAQFTFRPAARWRGGNERKMVAFIGDEVPTAEDRLRSILRARSKLMGDGFDMEPIEVLLSMIDDERFTSIGGQPQIVKVYRSLRTVPFAVRVGGSTSLFGRPLLNYEAPDRFPTIDLDNLQTEGP